jgi:hypothetical protein
VGSGWSPVTVQYSTDRHILCFINWYCITKTSHRLKKKRISNQGITLPLADRLVRYSSIRYQRGGKKVKIEEKY